MKIKFYPRHSEYQIRTRKEMQNQSQLATKDVCPDARSENGFPSSHKWIAILNKEEWDLVVRTIN